MRTPRDWDYEENKKNVLDVSKTNTHIQNSGFYSSNIHPLLKACANSQNASKQIPIIRECFRRSFDETGEADANISSILRVQKCEQPKETIQIDNISICASNKDDYDTLRKLAEQCAPLDVHTSYSYYALLLYFNDLCFIAYYKDIPIGFVSGFVRNKTGFIWQIGVLPSLVNQGIGSLLLLEIFHRFDKLGIDSVELTIDEPNQASFALFNKYCKNNNMIMNQVSNYTKYKSEILYRIEKR